MSTLPRLVLVGGFLGAGKTTLLWNIAKRLHRDNRRVALITNDQAPELVDTALLSGNGFEVAEVAGSCFCCNFPAFARAAVALRDRVRPEVVIAEPVGSCTDLSATILQPLKEKFATEFEIAPFSVLVDPARLRDVLSENSVPQMHPSAAYIMRKQLEEADIIVLNKTDLLAPAERTMLRQTLAQHFPAVEICKISALTGAGLDAWLGRVMNGPAGGQRILDVNYDTYAEGEAALGWLNADIRLSAPAPMDWEVVGYKLLEFVQAECKIRNSAVGHVKIWMCSETGTGIGNLTRSDGAIFFRAEFSAHAPDVRLMLNARVEMPPDILERIARDAVARAAGANVTVVFQDVRALIPGRPAPTFRYDHVVGG